MCVPLTTPCVFVVCAFQVASILGAKVTLTEQEQLLPLLERNVSCNFTGSESAPPRVMVSVCVHLLCPASQSLPLTSALTAPPPPPLQELSWGLEESQVYLQASEGRAPDVIIACDCVFEPLYGDSWKVCLLPFTFTFARLLARHLTSP